MASNDEVVLQSTAETLKELEESLQAGGNSGDPLGEARRALGVLSAQLGKIAQREKELEQREKSVAEREELRSDLKKCQANSDDFKAGMERCKAHAEESSWQNACERVSEFWEKGKEVCGCINPLQVQARRQEMLDDISEIQKRVQDRGHPKSANP